MINQKKKELFNKIPSYKLTEGIINDLYEFFGLTSGFVIFLFTALEAFINRVIPKDFIYKKVTSRNIEHYTKTQIERHISFDDKLKKVLTEATGKNFDKTYPIKYPHIDNLKIFRDSIIHTKASNEGYTPYDYLFKKAFNFKYEETINAVKDFCNFYFKPDYIEECPCSNDY